MSENDTNGTVQTVDPQSMDPQLIAQLLELKAKDDARKVKLAEAAAERKRTNNRGKLPDGVTDRNPTQAYLSVLGDLLTNWVQNYSEDPAQLLRRMTEQLVPSIVAMSNTASTQMAAAQDTRRQDMAAWKAQHAAKAPANSTK